MSEDLYGFRKVDEAKMRKRKHEISLRRAASTYIPVPPLAVDPAKNTFDLRKSDSYKGVYMNTPSLLLA